jgi:hypothetical protein
MGTKASQAGENGVAACLTMITLFPGHNHRVRAFLSEAVS